MWSSDVAGKRTWLTFGTGSSLNGETSGCPRQETVPGPMESDRGRKKMPNPFFSAFQVHGPPSFNVAHEG